MHAIPRLSWETCALIVEKKVTMLKTVHSREKSRSLIVAKSNALNASQKAISPKTVPTSMTRATKKRKTLTSKR